MATLTQTLSERSRSLSAEISGWFQENVIQSPYRLLLTLFLAWVAVSAFLNQWEASPALASLIGVLWLVGLAWVVISTLTHRFNIASQWLKDRLYNSSNSALLTLAITLWLTRAIQLMLEWALFNASFTPDARAAAASAHTGATWGIIFANIKLFMVGQFPSSQLWRVWASAGLVAILVAISFPVYGPFSAQLKPYRRWVTRAWLVSPLILWLLLRGIGGGGPLGLINTNTWGGLLLTLIISVFAIVVSFPLGILLALGRRSTFHGIPAWLTYGVVIIVAAWGLFNYTLPGLEQARTTIEYVLIFWPVLVLLAGVAFQHVFKGNVVAAFSTVYIEFVRGVPLITVLFMANLMLPLFLPLGMTIENAFRAMWGFALFSAAYLAENVRGGLQAISKGQYEAAEALGLSTVQQYRLIILPQALRLVIPPIVGQFIGLFKDTTLVAIVGLTDLLGIANAAVAQPDWLGLRREAYVFVSVVFYLGCFVMARIGYWLEQRLRVR